MDYFFGILTIGILAYVAIFEFFIPYIKQEKKNKEFMVKNNKKLRKLCLECKYCVKKKYHPFYYGELRNAMVQDIPMYCKKIKKQLNNKYNCRCQINDASQAFYEE